jgi:hypothetical protein
MNIEQEHSAGGSTNIKLKSDTKKTKDIAKILVIDGKTR